MDGWTCESVRSTDGITLGEKISLSAIISIWTGLGLIPCFRDERPATIHRNHGIATKLEYIVITQSWILKDGGSGGDRFMVSSTLLLVHPSIFSKIHRKQVLRNTNKLEYDN